MQVGDGMPSVLLNPAGRLWMTSGWLGGWCVVVGDCRRLCTPRRMAGESPCRLSIGISTSELVTGGLPVAKVFGVFGVQTGAQRFERCRIRVVSSLT